MILNNTIIIYLNKKNCIIGDDLNDEKIFSSYKNQFLNVEMRISLLRVHSNSYFLKKDGIVKFVLKLKF
ncbi:hypothetical protein BpHYR1_053634 [Brachionus plicatilis]|uniref:Uncharacterized protein n=1 Tax=Brachionus plicatilis TaxID=10195 RepID=A0A3M7PFA4_BRAPC|nr:hypothetical protein BpHYR1_053634 [Brachionus plicatilis]